MASAKYEHFINLNKAPSNASKIGVYNSNGERVGGITIPQSNKINTNTLGEKQYSFGCVADIHLQYDTATDDFKKALQYFNENENVAFTCICGDLSKNGLESELQTYKEYVDTYSPNTPVYAISGNHEGFNSSILSILEKYTERPLYYSIEYQNDVFVFCGIKASKEGELFTTEELQWLYETLEENRNKRIFLFSHVRPQDASGNAFGIYNYDIWGGNEQIIFESLVNHYKNVILFHGHSHLKFYLQYGAKNANIDTDLGMYSIHIPSLSVPRDGDVTGANSRQEIYSESEGYVVDVYENGIVLKGRDFVAEKFVPIAYYQLNTNLKTISPNGYVDKTGTLNTGDAFSVDTPISVSVGNTKILNVVTNISNYSVTYNSSNEGVATVSDSGVVTGVSEGTCIITLTENKTGMTAECEVTVLAKDISQNIVEVYSYSGNHSFAQQGEQITEDITLPKGKKLYAKWDSAEYSGGTLSNATTQKVGIAGFNSSKGFLTSDYQNFSEETLLTEGLSEETTMQVYYKASSSSTASFPVSWNVSNFKIYYYDDGGGGGGDDDTKTNVVSISNTYTFANTSDTQYDQTHNVTAGKKLYAKWDGITYSGNNSTTEKVGVVISACDASDTMLGSVTDYQDYSNEIELTDRTNGTNLGTLNNISYIRIWIKASSSSTASFPVTMTLNNFSVYTKE